MFPFAARGWLSNSRIYFTRFVKSPVFTLRCIKFISRAAAMSKEHADIMKKERVIAGKKMKTITKPKTVIDLGEYLPIFSAVWNFDLGNLNMSITANIKDLLAPLTLQIRELRNFLNFHTKWMDRELNFDNNLSDIICDKEKVKLEELISKKHS